MNVQAIFILMVVQLFGKEIAVTIEELAGSTGPTSFAQSTGEVP